MFCLTPVQRRCVFHHYTCLTQTCLRRGTGKDRYYPGGGGGGHCHHHDGLILLMMGSDESRFKVPFNARRKATRRCTQSVTYEEKGEPSRAMERRRLPAEQLITARPDRPTRTWAMERRRPLTSRTTSHRQARPARKDVGNDKRIRLTVRRCRAEVSWTNCRKLKVNDQ